MIDLRSGSEVGGALLDSYGFIFEVWQRNLRMAR